ncbi:MAG: DUF3459 domain-containing protein, partial [Chloroflexota bacterium]
DADLRAFYQNLIGLRHQHPVLRRGTFEVLHAAGQALVYLRRLEQELAVVVINRSAAASYEVNIPAAADLPEGLVWRNVLGSGGARVDNRRLHGLTLPPLNGAVLLPAA